jgi:hypothetical protein
MTQVQLAHTEAQRFALVQDVAEMQNQVAEMEIEVEVWQAMAHQGITRRSHTGCTCRSGRATGSFGLERGQCWRSTTRFSGY